MTLINPFSADEKVPGRFSEWWNHKTPLLANLIYGSMILSGKRFSLQTCGLFLISYVSLASFGYFVNDFFDIKSDQLGGKVNRVSTIGWGKRLVFITISLAGSFLPWLGLPQHPVIFWLLVAELALLLLYAAPPVRLKNKGLIAIIADSCYAFVIPSMITLALFGGAERLMENVAFYSLIFLIGIRNILMHQYLDFDSDTQSGTSTMATIYGKTRIKRVVERIVCPLELITGFALAIHTGRIFYFLPILFIIYAVFVYFRETYFYVYLGRALPRGYNFVNDLILNGFYTQWVAPFLLAGVIWNDHAMFWLPLIHYAVFYRLLIELIRDLRFCYPPVKSVAVKYYYRYLTFGYQRVYYPLKKRIIKHGA